MKELSGQSDRDSKEGEGQREVKEEDRVWTVLPAAVEEGEARETSANVFSLCR